MCTVFFSSDSLSPALSLSHTRCLSLLQYTTTLPDILHKPEEDGPNWFDSLCCHRRRQRRHRSHRCCLRSLNSKKLGSWSKKFFDVKEMLIYDPTNITYVGVRTSIGIQKADRKKLANTITFCRKSFVSPLVERGSPSARGSAIILKSILGKFIEGLLIKNSSLNGWIITMGNRRTGRQQKSCARHLPRMDVWTFPSDNKKIKPAKQNSSETKLQLNALIYNCNFECRRSHRKYATNFNVNEENVLEYAFSLIREIMTNAMRYVRLRSDEIVVVRPLPRRWKNKEKILWTISRFDQKLAAQLHSVFLCEENRRKRRKKRATE